MTIHISPERKIVSIPTAPTVENLFPAAPKMDFAGQEYLLLPHAQTETYLLRKLGYDIPAPILTHYDWAGGSPFDVQRQTGAMLTMNQRGYVLNDMGTGKTKAALWAWDYLRSNGHIGKVLVTAPLSTLSFTWEREIFSTIPHRKAVVLHGTKERRLQRLNDPDAEIFIVNPDGLKVLFDELTARTDINAWIIDELATFRHGSSQRSKNAMKLAARMDWVWGMTGSPIPTGPTDVWAQARIVTPDRVPKYFGRFRDELMTKINAFKYVPKNDAVERAFDVLQPAVRFKLDDVVELPECIERTIDVDLGPKQEKIYKALMKDCYAAVQSKEITAANAGVVMMKLLQVATGWVYAGDGSVVPLDNDKRVEALIDAVNATDRKVLVFVPFKHALAGISEAFTSQGIEHAVVSGDTPAKERADIFNLFQNTSKYHAIAAHPQCLAHGITLTAADTVIWFAPVTSLEIYEQANRRIRRIGQSHKQLLLHLQSTPVEKRIYSLLQKNQKVQERLLELFEDDTEANPQR